MCPPPPPAHTHTAVRVVRPSVQGADVNAKDKDEISGLMEASIMGHVDVVKEMLKVREREREMHVARMMCDVMGLQK